MGFDNINDQQTSSRFDEENTYPSMEDESVRGAVGGLMLLSEIDPAALPPPPLVVSSEEFPPATLEGKTWDCKKIRSGIKSCSAPPPSPENEVSLLSSMPTFICFILFYSFLGCLDKSAMAAE